MVWQFAKLKHGWRGFNGDQMTLFWPTLEEAQADADILDDAREEIQCALTGEGCTCGVCGRGFTQPEWDDRHDDDDEPDAYYHAECCPICKAADASLAEIYGEVDA